MAFQKKTWVDRLVEFSGRRKLKIVSSSETEIVADVYREEGNVSREGDPYNAVNMNDLEQRIYEGISNVETNINNMAKSIPVTQAQYNAMGSGRPNNLYVIVG